MIMKKVSLLLMMFIASLGATTFAQTSLTEDAGRKVTFERNGFWDNWFVGAGVGSNLHIDKQVGKGDLMKQFSLAGDLQVGKWLSPIWGGRLKGTFGSDHTFWGKDNVDMARQKFLNVQVDALFDVTNYFMTYSPQRMYHFILAGGAGLGFDWKAKLRDEVIGKRQRFVTVNASIINRFQVNPAFAIDLEVQGAVIPSGIKGAKRFPSKRRYNGMLTPQINFVYNFGNSATSPTAAFYAETVGYTGKTYGFVPAGALDQALFDGLNNEINALRQRNALLEKRPERCPECPKLPTVSPAAPVASTFLSNVVRFNINSANIQPEQQVSIYTTAEYLKENPTAKVRVVGYADKNTGTASYNEKLSEKRAKAVANELVKKYGINSDRVIVEWKGSSVQPYPQNNNWNRVVIFQAD